MRSIILVILGAVLFSVLNNSCADASRKEKKMKGTITLSGAWALYPMVVKWAEEFRNLYPTVKIDISAGGAGKGMADCLAGIVDIGMVSREVYPEELKKGALVIPVTKDAVVPTLHVHNPVLSDILKKGVRRETLIGIWITGEITTWGQVVGTSNQDNVHVYTRSDACGAAQTWAIYLGENQEDLRDVGVYGDPGLAEAVRNDARGIGFNNINYAYDLKTGKPVEGIRILPLDLNGNGRLDAEEDFYETLDQIVEAIADDRYPSPPARELYFITNGRPEREIVRKFIEWVLTKGQRFVPESGYIRLGDVRIREGLQLLDLQ